MRFFLVLISLFYFSQLFAQQEIGCKTNLFLEARIDSVMVKKVSVKVKNDSLILNTDSGTRSVPRPAFVDYAAVREKYYVLKPPAPAYVIVSFKVMTEDGEYINEVLCQGNIISQSAERIIWQRKAGTPVYFTCIMVKHPNGKIYTLKDLTVNLP